MSAFEAGIDLQHKCRERASTVPQENLPCGNSSGESVHRTISPELIWVTNRCTADRSMPGPYIGSNENLSSFADKTDRHNS